jgi:hypothetical protein
MGMSWGVLYQAFPLTGGKKGRFCPDGKKTRSFRRSFRASFFNLIKQARLSLLVAGCLLFLHG